MKGPKFILSRLKEDFQVSEEDEQKGFPDMNYIIGNSSAMDIGEVPTPLDQRIGYASQIGGSLMELQITNPATFSLEGDQMIDVIDQLGIDITLHPDMNAGYTTAYKTGAGESYGYDTVEQYFTNYIQELALFKRKVERKGKGGQPLFNIGRMNPHISTSPMPSLSERMAQDIGLDPFGYEISNFNEDYFKSKSRKGKNIYDNPEFLRRFYRLFVIDEIGENEYRYFQNFYTSVSSKFDKEWRRKQNEVLNEMYDDRTGENGSELKDKIELLSTASMRENVTTEWLDILGNDEISGFDDSIENPLYMDQDKSPSFGPENIENLEDLDRFISAISQRYRLSQLRTLPEIYYFIANEDLSRMASSERRDLLDSRDLSGFKSKVKEEFEDKMPDALDELWTRDPREENERTKVSLISVQGKITAMVRELEIPDNWVQEKTFDEHKDDLRNEIEEMFAGEDPSYFQDEEGAEDIDWEERHRRFLQSFGRNFEQQMWMESNLFYRIIPGWMATSNEEWEGHKGWKSPRFIWKTIIENKWNQRENIDIDLANPRKNGSGDKGYFDLLEDNQQFQMDVAAAVGACYAWAHFTQRKVQFNLKNRNFGLSSEEKAEVESEGWTWVKWMNKFGLGVNLETMQGSPQQRFKIWRPKDIAVTAHAINMTAREELGDINPELDGRPAKFTIDMEHVATMGVPPMDEMELFIDQEEKLAEDNPELELDTQKPISKIMRQIHLMDPGVEAQRGTHHGAIDRGDKRLYTWLYRFVEEGFTRNSEEQSTILFELAEHKGESSYMMRIMMNMIELGIEPDEVTPDNVDPGKDKYEDEREALIARFFGMDKANYSKEWAKIEEHAFDPLEGLLEAEQFDYTYSSVASLEAENNPRDYAGEEYK